MGTEGRRCGVSVDGKEGASADFRVRGDIYTAGKPIVWGNLRGWKFIGTLHSVSLAPKANEWHEMVEQGFSQNQLTLSPTDIVPTLLNKDFSLTVELTATNINYPQSMCPLYFESVPGAASQTGFGIGHQASTSSIEVSMADGSSVATFKLNYAQALSLNTRHRVELWCVRITEGRRCGVSVDGKEGASAVFRVPGEIYTAGKPIVWGNLHGWKFIGTL